MLCWEAYFDAEGINRRLKQALGKWVIISNYLSSEHKVFCILQGHLFTLCFFIAVWDNSPSVFLVLEHTWIKDGFLKVMVRTVKRKYCCTFPQSKNQWSVVLHIPKFKISQNLQTFYIPLLFFSTMNFLLSFFPEGQSECMISCHVNRLSVLCLIIIHWASIGNFKIFIFFPSWGYPALHKLLLW